MSSEITDRRGYELPDTYSNLQELWRGHYDHFNELLKQFLLQSYQETEDRLELLEVGAGAKSVLLRGLEETLGESTCPQAIQVHFVDPEPLSHIQPACLENSTLVADCQAAAKGQFKSISDDREISWRFTQEDFFTFLEREERYHLILLHGVLHEIHLHSGSGPEEFFPDFFRRLGSLLQPGGRILISDTYYPLYFSREEVVEMIEWQRTLTHHADPPEAFVHPERIVELLLSDPEASSQYKILLEEQRRYRARLSGSSRARKFYTLGLQLETADQSHPQ
jgi:SAM-dependent methyltransferase